MSSATPTPVLSQLESALETSCAALVAVEAIRARASTIAEDLHSIQAQIADTIASLRAAIAEFRTGHGSEASLLAFGFVLETNRGGHPQLSPRRTA